MVNRPSVGDFLMIDGFSRKVCRVTDVHGDHLTMAVVWRGEVVRTGFLVWTPDNDSIQPATDADLLANRLMGTIP